MASIDKRPDGGNRARWREYPGGPPKDRQFARKGDAQLFLDAIRGDLAHGLYVDPAGGRTLFRDDAEEWRSTQVHRSGTATQFCANWLTSGWGGKPTRRQRPACATARTGGPYPLHQVGHLLRVRPR